MSSENPRLNSFPLMNDDLNIISALPNTPLPPDYTASSLKAKFDESANKIKSYINSALKSAIEQWLEDIAGYADSLDSSQGELITALSSRVSAVEGSLVSAFDGVMGAIQGYVDPIAVNLAADITAAAENFTLGQLADNSITASKLERSIRFGNDRYSISAI